MSQKSIIGAIVGAIIGAGVTHIPLNFWHFLASNAGNVLTGSAGVVAAAYTIYQEYREYQRHGSVKLPKSQVPK